MSKTTETSASTTSQQLGSLIKSARDIMRKDKGLSGDLDRLPMLTWIMFLKFLDDMEHIDESKAKVRREKYRPVVEPPYRWRDWAAREDGITGPELLAFVNHEEATRPDGKKGPGLFAYLTWAEPSILQTASEESPAALPPQIFQTLSGESTLSRPSPNFQTVSGESSRPLRFPLPWSHYVELLKLDDPAARQFYEAETLRGGWTVRQLRRQIGSCFYQRTLLSRNKAAMLTRHVRPRPQDAVTAEEEIKDPFVLEFLGLQDEYGENDLEAAIAVKLEAFLLELGADFCFVGRQRRLRIGDTWYRVDLIFFHRRLRCLVIIDLKLGEFTHADAGQMHLYLNYAAAHWTHPGENPPVGLILCAQKDAAVARYALDNLPNKVMAAEYRMNLPDEKRLEAEVQKTRRLLETRPHPPKGGRR